MGVIGLGAMGKNHARVLSGMNSVDEVFLYDPQGLEVGEVQGRVVGACFESFLEQELDYCIVSSPTITHRNVALRLAALDIPTLIEKPVAFSVEEALEVCEAFEDRNLLGSVGHIERYNPAIIALNSALRAGVLGEIFQINTRRVGPFPNRIRDVGVVKDLATHDIDLVEHLSGSAYDSIQTQLWSRPGLQHEDSLLSIGTLSSGVQFSHVVNWISPNKERVTSVLGEKGLLVADTLTPTLTMYESGQISERIDSGSYLHAITEGEIHKLDVGKTEPLVREHEVFQQAMTNQSLNEIVSLRQGLQVLKVAERMLT